MPHASILLWCAAQATVILLAALLVHWAIRPRSARLRVLVGVLCTASILVVTSLAWSPWPSWTRLLGGSQAERDTARATNSAPPVDGQSVADASPTEGLESDGPESHPTAANLPDHGEVGDPWGPMGWVVRAWLAADPESHAKPLDADIGTGRWLRMGLVAAILFSVLLAAVRLALGAWSLRSLLSGSSPIADRVALEQLDALARELGTTRTVELRQTCELPTAATVGWRRPVILVPVHWQDWPLSQLQCVLAHELAHIRHGDFLVGLVAQMALLLHFYHPLLHWLVRRLRLDQEIAADALAARISGGRAEYLRALALLALDHPGWRTNWSAQAFLPTRGTFLRRIEMLRDPRHLSLSSTRAARLSCMTLLLAAAVIAAGLRAPRPAALAQAPPSGGNSPPGGSSESAQPLRLAYVPPLASNMVVLRPRAIAENPHWKEVMDVLVQPLLADFRVGNLELGAFDVDQVVTGAVPFRPDSRQFATFTIVHFASDEVADRVDRSLRSRGTPFVATRRAGKRTFLSAASADSIQRMVQAGEQGAAPATWKAALQSAPDAQFAALVDSQYFEVTNAGPSATPLSPLWKHAQHWFLAGSLGQDGSLRITIEAPILLAENVPSVVNTLEAARTLAINTLDVVERDGKPANFPPSLVPVARQALEQAEITSDEGRVVANIALDSDTTSRLVPPVIAALGQARRAAREALTLNNLKQIALAMYNYEATHQTFPPAVLGGSDGEPPRSWRVELLPYLNRNDLYEKYRKNEPWDSPHNLQLVEQMPDVYRSPFADPGSTDACYFVVTGPGTLFSDANGTRLLEVTDGTSNTLFVFEAKRAIPWTKPEDIPFRPDGELPSLDDFHPGTIFAALADGSVRRFDDLGADLLRSMIQIADGGPTGGRPPSQQPPAPRGDGRP